MGAVIGIKPTPVVEVMAKNVYGRVLYYPANDEAYSFCALTGNDTLRKQDAKHIRALGYEIRTLGVGQTERL